MIPFFQYTELHVGPITIQVWGLLVALGMLTGLWYFYTQAKKRGLDGSLVLDLGLYAIIGGVLMARLFHIFLYEPAYYLANPAEMIAFWHGGSSSLGGFVGAAVAAIIFCKKRKITWGTFVPYFDIGILGLWLGWGIGRIGCFLIHDHPGTLSSFVLAVRYPAGARHDLGLYDSLLAFGIFIVFSLLFKKLVKKGSGLVALYSIITYATVRFFFDFLRIADVKYWYFTPAQWGMLTVVIALTLVLGKSTVRQPK